MTREAIDGETVEVACARTKADPTVTRQHHATRQLQGHGKSPGKKDKLQDGFELLGLAAADVRKRYVVCIYF